MTKEEIIEAANDVENKPNKVLLESLNILGEEFNKTKLLIIDLTRHLDSIELLYNNVNNEIKKRKTK